MFYKHYRCLRSLIWLRVSDLALELGSLETRFGSIEAWFNSMMNLNNRIGDFLQGYMISRMLLPHLMMWARQTYHCVGRGRDLRTSLMEKIVSLEDRCVVLEGSTKAINRSSTVDDLESRIRSFELSQRDYEINISLILTV